jgi:hypothetical protein
VLVVAARLQAASEMRAAPASAAAKSFIGNPRKLKRRRRFSRARRAKEAGMLPKPDGFHPNACFDRGGSCA